MARTAGIWITGTLASMIVGALVAAKIAAPLNPIAEFEGALAGALAFACLRLWIVQRST